MVDTIDFFFDFASPYGYLAAREIESLAERHGVTTRWHPILLGVVFKVTGAIPNLAAPLRGDYLRRDVARIARLRGVPMVLPDSAPISGVRPSRAFYWLNQSDPLAAKGLAMALFDAHWLAGRDISQAETVLDIAKSLGQDRVAMAAGMELAVVKEQLREETDTAIARGVFGAPFIFVGDEPFWGWDRLPMVEEWLTRGGW